MLIVKRIKNGPFKGYTIRKSKYNWYSVYSSNGVSQSSEKLTLEEANNFIQQKTKEVQEKRNITKKKEDYGCACYGSNKIHKCLCNNQLS